MASFLSPRLTASMISLSKLKALTPMATISEVPSRRATAESAVISTRRATSRRATAEDIISIDLTKPVFRRRTIHEVHTACIRVNNKVVNAFDMKDTVEITYTAASVIKNLMSTVTVPASTTTRPTINHDASLGTAKSVTTPKVIAVASEPTQLAHPTDQHERAATPTVLATAPPITAPISPAQTLTTRTSGGLSWPQLKRPTESRLHGWTTLPSHDTTAPTLSSLDAAVSSPPVTIASFHRTVGSLPSVSVDGALADVPLQSAAATSPPSCPNSDKMTAERDDSTDDMATFVPSFIINDFAEVDHNSCQESTVEQNYRVGQVCLVHEWDPELIALGFVTDEPPRDDTIAVDCRVLHAEQQQQHAQYVQYVQQCMFWQQQYMQRMAAWYLMYVQQQHMQYVPYPHQYMHYVPQM